MEKSLTLTKGQLAHTEKANLGLDKQIQRLEQDFGEVTGKKKGATKGGGRIVSQPSFDQCQPWSSRKRDASVDPKGQNGGFLSPPNGTIWIITNGTRFYKSGIANAPSWGCKNKEELWDSFKGKVAKILEEIFASH